MRVNTFECDKNKARSNLVKHRIRFTEAARIFEGHTLTTKSNQTDHDEERFTSIGSLSVDLLIVLVWTRRGQNIRVISVRKARTKEKEQFNANIKKTLN